MSRGTNNTSKLLQNHTTNKSILLGHLKGWHGVIVLFESRCHEVVSFTSSFTLPFWIRISFYKTILFFSHIFIKDCKYGHMDMYILKIFHISSAHESFIGPAKTEGKDIVKNVIVCLIYLVTTYRIRYDCFYHWTLLRQPNQSIFCSCCLHSEYIYFKCYCKKKKKIQYPYL